MTTLDTVNTNSESLAARAYRILLDRLIMLDIQPGEPIMEKQLAEEMGWDALLREALKHLRLITWWSPTLGAARLPAKSMSPN